ncbi:MAG: hypothetical protein ACUVR8_07060 [Acidobacteriota bacterium]
MAWFPRQISLREKTTLLMPEKKPRRSLLEWLVPAFFMMVGTWYLLEWGLTSPTGLTFRAGVGSLLVIYGGWRIVRLWRQWALPPAG